MQIACDVIYSQNTTKILQNEKNLSNQRAEINKYSNFAKASILMQCSNTVWVHICFQKSPKFYQLAFSTVCSYYLIGGVSRWHHKFIKSLNIKVEYIKNRLRRNVLFSNDIFNWDQKVNGRFLNDIASLKLIFFSIVKKEWIKSSRYWLMC